MYLLFVGFGAALSYVVLSVFFWHHPTYLHKRKKVTFSASHISHRGGSAEGYENTLLNFQRAADSGTDMLELDVRLTKDGQVVVFHDADLKRLAGSTKSIADFDYDQLPRLAQTIQIDTIPGAFYSDETWPETQRRIPLLSQIFAEFPTLPINIDIKDSDSPQLISAVSDLIRQYERQDITVWGSFNNSVCQLLYKENPNVGLFFSARQVLILLFLSITGMLPFVPIKETHYEVFLPSSIKRRRLLQVDALTFREKMLFWGSQTFLVWKPLISHLRRRGIHVYLWVANSEEEYSECLELGANGIMTDYPSKLRFFLDNYAKGNNIHKLVK